MYSSNYAQLQILILVTIQLLFLHQFTAESGFSYECFNSVRGPNDNFHLISGNDGGDSVPEENTLATKSNLGANKMQNIHKVQISSI